MDGDKWVAMVDDDEDDLISDSVSTTDSFDDSTASAVSSPSSLELIEDASSCSSLASSSSSSFLPSTRLSQGPLYELSELMAHLPIKRGLSRHFQGKSQSFTSLSNVRCLEDLAKRESPLRKKMKSCKSYGGGLLDINNTKKRLSVPKTCSRTISKKVSSRGSSFSPNLLGKRTVLYHSCNPRAHFPA